MHTATRRITMITGGLAMSVAAALLIPSTASAQVTANGGFECGYDGYDGSNGEQPLYTHCGKGRVEIKVDHFFWQHTYFCAVPGHPGDPARRRPLAHHRRRIQRQVLLTNAAGSGASLAPGRVSFVLGGTHDRRGNQLRSIADRHRLRLLVARRVPRASRSRLDRTQHAREGTLSRGVCIVSGPVGLPTCRTSVRRAMGNLGRPRPGRTRDRRCRARLPAAEGAAGARDEQQIREAPMPLCRLPPGPHRLRARSPKATVEPTLGTGDQHLRLIAPPCPTESECGSTRLDRQLCSRRA